MCLRCNGLTEEEILASRLQLIQTYGWSITYVAADEDEAAFAYTIGLTRFHGHPELLVSGLDQPSSGGLLNELGGQVRSGVRFEHGDLIQEGQHRFQFVQVEDPRELIDAQETYASRAGLVPGLQVIYSDPRGHWPWECGGILSQPLFGTPPHR
jgi:hypothetical protein